MQPLGDLGLDVETAAAGLPRPAFIAECSRAQVPAGQTIGDALGFKAAVIDALGDLVPRQGLVAELGPARSFPVGGIFDFGALAVDRVELDDLFAEGAVRLDVAGRDQQVSVPVGVVAAAGVGVDFPVLIGIRLEVSVGDRPRGVQGDIDGDPVSLGELPGVFQGELLARLIGEITR